MGLERVPLLSTNRSWRVTVGVQGAPGRGLWLCLAFAALLRAVFQAVVAFRKRSNS